jgi:hypothetical protein
MVDVQWFVCKRKIWIWLLKTEAFILQSCCILLSTFCPNKVIPESDFKFPKAWPFRPSVLDIWFTHSPLFPLHAPWTLMRYYASETFGYVVSRTHGVHRNGYSLFGSQPWSTRDNKFGNDMDMEKQRARKRLLKTLSLANSYVVPRDTLYLESTWSPALLLNPSFCQSPWLLGIAVTHIALQTNI